MTAAQTTQERVHPAERRERLLDAALEVFLERGYAGATVRTIAHRAGVTEGLIYHYFSGKRELLLALLRERSPAAAAVGLGEHPTKKRLDAALEDLMRRVLDAFENDSDVLLLLFGEAMVDDEVAAVWAEIVKESAAAIAVYLVRLQKDGTMSAGPTDTTAQLLISACLMYFLNVRRLRVPGLVTDRERFIAGTAGLFERALALPRADADPSRRRSVRR